jgi:hypothetical protein
MSSVGALSRTNMTWRNREDSLSYAKSDTILESCLTLNPTLDEVPVIMRCLLSAVSVERLSLVNMIASGTKVLTQMKRNLYAMEMSKMANIGVAVGISIVLMAWEDISDPKLVAYVFDRSWRKRRREKQLRLINLRHCILL